MKSLITGWDLDCVAFQHIFLYIFSCVWTLERLLEEGDNSWWEQFKAICWYKIEELDTTRHMTVLHGMQT